MSNWVIELCPDEIAIAYHVGASRQHYHLVRNSTSATPNLRGDNRNDIVRLTEANTVGVMAEMALAKKFNLYWSPTMTWEKGGSVDVGGMFEVRAKLVVNSKVDQTDLPLRPTDKALPHVLCWVNPPKVALMGWMTLSQFEQDDDRDKYWFPNNKPPCWYLPWQTLNKMDEIEVRRTLDEIE